MVVNKGLHEVGQAGVRDAPGEAQGGADVGQYVFQFLQSVVAGLSQVELMGQHVEGLLCRALWGHHRERFLLD
jgi:urea transporter